MAIQGLHGMFYSSEAEALRAFFRDKLGFPCKDVGGGWLIFDMPSADLGCHPVDTKDGKPNGTADISFFTDDIRGTVTELREKGVSFRSNSADGDIEGGDSKESDIEDCNIEDRGYGFVALIEAPGDLTIQLYQPKY